ncbi:MAG: AI-2E family transporter [bacterium]
MSETTPSSSPKQPVTSHFGKAIKPNYAQQRWFWLTVISLFLGLVYLLAPILTPFLMAALLAYLGDPLVDRLETWKLSRTLSVAVVFIALILMILVVLLVLLPIIETQLAHLVQKMPRYIDNAVLVLQPYLLQEWGVNIENIDQEIKAWLKTNLSETGGFVQKILKTISASGALLIGWATTLFLTPVITFYLLRDWDHLVAFIHDLLPRRVEPVVSQLAKEADDVLGAFLRGQLLVMLALGLLYSLGLTLVGVEFAFLIGMLAGLLSFVPYLGLIVGVLVAGLAVLLQTQSIVDLLLVFGVFGIAQLIEGVILTPLLVGERIGLHPVAVIFAVLAGGQLFGFFGVLLGLPAAAVVAVILRYMRDSYKNSAMYQT